MKLGIGVCILVVGNRCNCRCACGYVLRVWVRNAELGVPKGWKRLWVRLKVKVREFGCACG